MRRTYVVLMVLVMGIYRFVVLEQFSLRYCGNKSNTICKSLAIHHMVRGILMNTNQCRS